MAEYDTVAIVGVGLIGGSIGLALRERRLAREVVGIGRGASRSTDPNHVGPPRQTSSLDAALKLGAIDRATTDLAAGVAERERRRGLHAGGYGGANTWSAWRPRAPRMH